ncbi:MAG: DNA cytosine methyltransferase [Bacteroidales bacterium]|nr:DNA cytosine methyltransferase [Bacteroidales bacterium]
MFKKLKYIDLFAGCGGLSLGLHNTGAWQGIFAIEKSPDAFATLEYNLIKKMNHFEWPDWLSQKNHDINEILQIHKNHLKNLRGSVDLVAGGPPCQGFSTAGRRIENDDRNSLIKSYIQFIRLVQPKIIFFENVKGFTQEFNQNKSKGIKYSEYVLKELKKSNDDYKGYNVSSNLIDFSKYGIPQKRTRFILVGIRKDISIKEDVNFFLKNIELNKKKFLINKGIEINTSLEDAISDLLRKNNEINSPDSKNFKAGKYGEIQSAYQKLMRQGVASKIPDSHRFPNHKKETIKLFNTLIQNTKKGKHITKNEKELFNVKRRSIAVLHPKNPTPTITTHPDDYIHYCESRVLTVRECARIQTFPDNYKIKGRYTTGGKRRKIEVPRYSQIGNAIPPLFGELAGITLKELIQ